MTRVERGATGRPSIAFSARWRKTVAKMRCALCWSGTGTDGTLGLTAVKEHGGMAMAQTLDSAKYDAICRRRYLPPYPTAQ